MNLEEIYFNIQSINKDNSLTDEVRTTRLSVYQALYYYVDGKTKLNNIMKSIIDNGRDLESKSNYEFFLKETLEKTRIMTKGYILDSRFIPELKKNGIEKYTFRDIEKYVQQYIVNTGDTMDDVVLAINLYSKIREYKRLYDDIYDRVKATLGELFGDEMLENTGDIRLKYQRIMERVERMNGRNLFDDKSKETLNALLNELFSSYINDQINLPIDVNEIRR